MTPVSDDEVRDMLEARGDRYAIDLRTVVEVARRDAIASPGSGRRPWEFGGLLAGFGSVVAIALALIIVVVPLSLRPNPAARPSPAATATAPLPSGEDGPAGAEALTAQGLADWLVDAGAAANGRVVLLEGELILDPSVSCFASAPDCPPTVVRKAPGIVVEPVGDIGPGPWDGSGPLVGTFALRGTDRTWAGTSPVMEFLGTVRRADNQLAWRVPDLLALAPADGPELYLVAGWIVRTPFHPCASPATAYGCPSDDLLTSERVQPTRADGSSVLPEISLRLPSGTYDMFAPDPAPDGQGVVPRAGTFLVQRVVIPPCGPTLAGCYVTSDVGHWVVRARVDPIEGSASPTPTPLAAGERYPGGIPRVIDGEPVLIGLDAQARWRDAIDATTFLVGGWFDSRTVITCSGGIGPSDPNPLAARGCSRYDVPGMPGRPIYPDSVAMPQGDGPIVLRVHTRDPGAATCIAEYIDECRRRVVVDAAPWFGDEATAAAPLGPREAISRATGVFVMEWRPEGDNTQHAVSEDIFTLPLACPAPWPTLLFSIHGDPRYGLVAVFPDPAARERFQASTPPQAARGCLANAIERPAGPRWVGYENVLVLAYADDVFANRLASVLEGPLPDQAALPMTEPELDRSLETITDYLVARANGSLDHARGERLIDPIVEDPGGPGDVVADAYAAWTADVFRRHAANALVGRIEALDDKPTRARVGPAAVLVLRDRGVTRSRIFRVTYPDAEDPALAMEEYLVVQMPESWFRDWQLIRITGEPYPQAAAVAKQP